MNTFTVVFQELPGRLSLYIGLAERQDLRRRIVEINADLKFRGNHWRVGRFLRVETHPHFGIVAVFQCEDAPPTLH